MVFNKMFLLDHVAQKHRAHSLTIKFFGPLAHSPLDKPLPFERLSDETSDVKVNLYQDEIHTGLAQNDVSAFASA